MRTARPLAPIASALAATILLAQPVSAGGDGEKRSKHLATEVCEPMVAEAVEAVAAKPLPAPPAASGRSRISSTNAPTTSVAGRC